MRLRFAFASALFVAFLLLLLPVFSTSQIPGRRPISAAESFQSHFDLPLPKTVKVAHYYGEDMPMDPSFAWELVSSDTAFLKKFVKKAGLKAATKTDRPNGHTYTWPKWWNKKTIESLPEVYFKDASSALVRVWVDRKKKRLYVEYVNL